MADESLIADILVVGCGPAGSAAAMATGKSKLKTIVIDRKPLEKIGDKVCGDALSPEYPETANKWIGFPIPTKEDGTLKEYCDEAVIIGKNPTTRLAVGSKTSTVDRWLYGQKILKELMKIPDVTVIPNTRVMNTIIEDGFLKGLKCYNQEKGNFEIRSKITIDASGASGAVRARLPDSMCQKFPKRIPKHEMIAAYREIIRTPEPHPFQKSIFLTYVPEIEEVMPGYYWFFSRGEKELNIGLGYMLYEKNVGKNLRKINSRVRERYFPKCEVLASQGHQIPARLPLPSLVHNGFMAAGDAGALANPLTGEGHGPAILSGAKAGMYAIDAIKKGDWSEEGLWEYNRWIAHTYGVEFSWGIAIVKFYLKHGMDVLDWIMRKGIIEEHDVLMMVNEPDRELPLIQRALRGIGRPRVLWDLRKTVNLAKNIQKHMKNYPDPQNFEPWLKKLKKLENTKI